MSKVSFKPAKQRVLVLPDENSDMTTKSGIIIPNSEKSERCNFGTIISTGDGEVDNPMLYRRGQRVAFSQYAGSAILLDLTDSGKDFGVTEFKLMNQVDIWGVITDLNNENLR